MNTSAVSTEKILLTTKEVSERTGIQIQTLCNWRVRGVGMPFIKMGEGKRAPVRYDVADILRYVDEHRHLPSVRESLEKKSGSRQAQ